MASSGLHLPRLSENMFLQLPFRTPAVTSPVSKQKPPKLAVLRSWREIQSTPILVSHKWIVSSQPCSLVQRDRDVMDLRVHTGYSATPECLGLSRLALQVPSGGLGA